MLLAGDEIGHSQGGNNNAYAQDNETGWIDWDDGRPGADRLCRTADRAAPRPCRSCGSAASCMRGRAPSDGLPDVIWRRADGDRAAPEDWHDPAFRCLGVELRMAAEGGDPSPDAVFAVFNTGPAATLHPARHRAGLAADA